MRTEIKNPTFEQVEKIINSTKHYFATEIYENRIAIMDKELLINSIGFELGSVGKIVNDADHVNIYIKGKFIIQIKKEFEGIIVTEI